MFARVSTYQGTPDRVEDAIRHAEQSAPDIQGMAGFRGAYFLVDRKSGKAMTITLWETEGATKATAAAVSPLRSRIAEALGASREPTVEVYEVASQS